MIEKILQAYDLEKNESDYPSINIEEPRQCNHCQSTGTQVFLEGIITRGVNDPSNGICIFACQLCGCSTIHFFRYAQKIFPGEYDTSYYLTPYDSFPTKILNNNEIPENIKMKYTEFVSIYEQSQKAEASGLNKIAGMGYRKSLEFLVTDFLLEYPTSDITEEWLTNPKTPLSSKIDKFTNERIKKLAKAVSFIGNDETHYTRRHPEHDTDSIKMFIKALLSDFENELTLKQAENLLNKPK